MSCGYKRCHRAVTQTRNKSIANLVLTYFAGRKVKNWTSDIYKGETQIKHSTLLNLIFFKKQNVALIVYVWYINGLASIQNTSMHTRAHPTCPMGLPFVWMPLNAEHGHKTGKRSVYYQWKRNETHFTMVLRENMLSSHQGSLFSFYGYLKCENCAKINILWLILSGAIHFAKTHFFMNCF